MRIKPHIQPRVIVYPTRDEVWVAHCVELDGEATGRSLEEALANLGKAIKSQIDYVVGLAFDRATRLKLLFGPIEPFVLYLFAAGEDIMTEWCKIEENDFIALGRPLVRLLTNTDLTEAEIGWRV